MIDAVVVLAGTCAALTLAGVGVRLRLAYWQRRRRRAEAERGPAGKDIARAKERLLVAEAGRYLSSKRRRP